MTPREHLAGANSRVTAARTRLAAVKDAINRCWTDRGDAHSKVDAIEDALKEVTASAPARAVSAYVAATTTTTYCRGGVSLSPR